MVTTGGARGGHWRPHTHLCRGSPRSYHHLLLSLTQTLAENECVYCISSDFHSSSPLLPVVCEGTDLNIPVDMFCHNRRWLWFSLWGVMADPAPRWKHIIPPPAGTAHFACLFYTSNEKPSESEGNIWQYFCFLCRHNRTCLCDGESLPNFFFLLCLSPNTNELYFSCAECFITTQLVFKLCFPHQNMIMWRTDQ